MTEYEDLYQQCLHVRLTIERCVKNNPSLYNHFPHGYCNHVSIWLYDYLTSKDYKSIEFHMRRSFMNSDCNHVWLYWNGYNIDLTCDQFNDENSCFDTVIVSKINSNYKEFDMISNRKERIDLEYNPYRILCAFPDSEKERDIIYEELGLDFISFY